jgi:hypothetical protein
MRGLQAERQIAARMHAHARIVDGIGENEAGEGDFA